MILANEIVNFCVTAPPTDRIAELQNSPSRHRQISSVESCDVHAGHICAMFFNLCGKMFPKKNKDLLVKSENFQVDRHLTLAR